MFEFFILLKDVDYFCRFLIVWGDWEGSCKFFMLIEQFDIELFSFFYGFYKQKIYLDLYLWFCMLIKVKIKVQKVYNFIISCF